MRPGEKLFEELLTDEEHTVETRHPKIRIARFSEMPSTQWDDLVRQWLSQPGKLTDTETRKGLLRFIPEYRPAELVDGIRTSALSSAPLARPSGH
jgi:FlaA1/EpsC-like NDP-sugar epimerase